MRRKSNPNPDKLSREAESSVSDGCVTAVRWRVNLGSHQEARAAQALYVVHDFRNTMVTWMTDRRLTRARWLKAHPVLAKEWVPKELSGSDAVAGSRWLTKQLERARDAARTLFGFGSEVGKNQVAERFAAAWATLPRDQRADIRRAHENQRRLPTSSPQVVSSSGISRQEPRALDPATELDLDSEYPLSKDTPGLFLSSSPHVEGIHLLWLLVPRTALDQVIQDLDATNRKAIKDRATNKARRAGGLKNQKTAGFPVRQKWTFATSLRLQVITSRQTAFREGWELGKLILPGFGRMSIREHGQAGAHWPKTPPKLITLARAADGNWFVSFVCAQGEGSTARRRRLKQQAEQASRPKAHRNLAAQGFDSLPLNPLTGCPAIEGLDPSLPQLAVSNVHGPLGRTRYLKRYARKQKIANKTLSRRQRGSRRWAKAARICGVLHTRIANIRQADLRAQAQTVAHRSAIVCLEDCHPSFMLQNPKLAASAHDWAWGLFVKELTQAMAVRGHLLLKSGRFDPTTQLCPTPGCDYRNPELKGFSGLNIRDWVCPQCGVHHDRDHAASENIQALAIERYLIEREQTLKKSARSQPALNLSTLSLESNEHVVGAESALGMTEAEGRLHPDLVSFMVRGGLRAWVSARREGPRIGVGNHRGGWEESGKRESVTLSERSGTERSTRRAEL